MTPSDREFARIGVVVPAHNEEELLPDCLSALRSAAAAVDIPVHLLVVLDACTDRTAEVAEPTAVIEVWKRSVGAARRAGFTRLMREVGADQVWLATTDADTRVPHSWLADQLAHARRGVDAVAGMVNVTDWRGHAPAVVERFRRLHPLITGHHHVHGANLGMSAGAYCAAGGFPPLPAHEDLALIAALQHSGHYVLHSADPPVITSARRCARAPAGFAHFLVQLAEPEPEPDPVS